MPRIVLVGIVLVLVAFGLALLFLRSKRMIEKSRIVKVINFLITVITCFLL